MDAIKFTGSNTVYAENQEEYNSLPAHRTECGDVTCCWKLTFKERLKVLFTGQIFSTISTFNQKLQPQRLSLDFEAAYWNAHKISFEEVPAGTVESNIGNEVMNLEFQRYMVISDGAHSVTGLVDYLRRIGFNARVRDGEGK